MRIGSPFSLCWLVLAAGCVSTSTAFDFDKDGIQDAYDCAPNNADIYPGNDDEIDPEGIDSNCDGIDGEDQDGDGYPGNAEVSPPQRDCNDSDPEIHPGAPDPWGDEGGVDSNCDGPDGVDHDGDGYPGNADADSPQFDCDDDNPLVHPDAVEDDATPLDEDCDGDGADFDGDGFDTPTDCNDDPEDGGASMYPGAPETCNGLDDDCDELVDEDADGLPAFDADGDGWNSCSECDDGRSWVHPEAVEVCDGVDNDCDSEVDEDSAQGTPGSFLCPWNVGGGSCREILDAGDSLGSGTYTIQPNLSEPADSVYCDMGHSGGGWTLVLIAADDGVDTWTWENLQWLTLIPAPVGDLGSQAADFASASDFKSPAYHSLLFSDLLFIHHSAHTGSAGVTPFETWAAYDGVGDGSMTLPAFMLTQVTPSCLPMWEMPPYVPSSAVATAYPLTDGTLVATDPLCDTNLYFHLGGHATYEGRECDEPPYPTSPHSYGPSWSARLGPELSEYNCGSGPGWSSLGPGANYWVDVFGWVDPVDESLIELPGLGFGEALGLNLADPGTGVNHLRMYVR